MTEQTEINPIAEEAEAIDRIARTYDGQLLHRYLRRVLETCTDLVDSGALQAHNGRRTLARDLMRLMASGIEGSSDRRHQQRGDEFLLGGRHGPNGSDRRYRGTNRRVGPDESVARFLNEHGDADPS